MIRIRRRARKPIIPLNAMSDIGFLLLIFIMLLALINDRKEIRIDYPEAELVENTESEHNYEIWIDRDGNVFVEGAVMTPAELEQDIIKNLAGIPDMRIHILADRNTPYRHVDKVVKILQMLQHRAVSFVVKEE